MLHERTRPRLRRRRRPGSSRDSIPGSEQLMEIKSRPVQPVFPTGE